MSLHKIKNVITDYVKFSENFLKIKSKSGNLINLKLNESQLYAHHRLENQLKSTGKVRALVIKGRQAGLSTYIQSRYFHKIITRKGKKAFILTHESEATKNLFEMTKRFYENLPTGLCPEADRSSAKELKFLSLDSGYSVGTAGNKAVGRSQTIQLFHGCLDENTLIYDVLTSNVKKIKDFKVGDFVKTHTNEIAPISYISKQEKECIELKFRSLTQFPLIATKKHLFWTKKGWKELGELNEGDSIGYPITFIKKSMNKLKLPSPLIRKQGGGRQSIVKDQIKINYEFGRIVGLYLAEGHIKLQYHKSRCPANISFTIHRKEVDRTVNWLIPFNDYYTSMHIKHRKGSLTSVVTIYGNRFSSLINNLCGRTKEKHVPYLWHEMGEDFCKGIFHGYISGDGSSYDTDRRVRAQSICSAITIPFRDISASLGYGWASIEYKNAALRNGRNEKERFTFSLCGSGATKLAKEIGKPTQSIKRKKVSSTKKYAACTTKIENGYAWLRINSIKKAGLRNVYDFEINHKDHSYCTIHGASHNSEVAYWPSAEEHAKGIMQAVSNEPGTEIILESTANGIGNYFYNMWQSVKSGNSDYQSIFVPWYWQQEYRDFRPGLILTEEETELLDYYSKGGLTKEHISWRRIKIAELSCDAEAGREQFYSEYPMTAEEAFRNKIDNVFISSKYVLRARNNDVQSDVGIIIGVDPAISDNDKTAIIRRKGRLVYGLETFRNHNTMEIAGKLNNIIRQENPIKVYIDCIGIGAGIVDRLQEMGHQCVEGINVARSANDKEKYGNLRAELWGTMKDFLMQNELPVQIPDDDELHGALVSLGYKFRSNGQLIIESKDDLRKRSMPSPDEADAMSLTFFSGIYATDQILPVTKIPLYERGMFN